MGTTTSFFGGGSGGTVLDAPNQGFANTIDFAANTQFAAGGGGRGLAARVIPCKSNTFFLLEGNATSTVYVSYWSIDDSGAATQEAAAIQINSSVQQVRAAAANGVDRLMIKTDEGGPQRLRQIYYNGSTLSTTGVSYVSTANYRPTTTVTCTSDGILLGCIGRTTSNNQALQCGAVRPDGTTINTAFNSSFHSEHGRYIGTGDGIIGCGRQTQNTRTARVEKISINTANNSALSVLSHINNNVEVLGYYGPNANNPPYIIPTKGGAYAVLIDGSGYQQEFSLVSFGQQVNIVSYANQVPYGPKLDNGHLTNLNRSLGLDSTFCRQSNGTYLHFIAQNTSHYVTFDPANHNHHAPFGTIRPVGDGSSSGCDGAISTAIVGKFVISTWYDSTDGDVNIDAWNYRG